MAGYSTSNPPVLQSQSIAGVRTWVYESVDAASLVDIDGYFTNGYELGMREGDIVFVRDTDANPTALTLHVVDTATAADGVDLTEGVAVSGANSD